MLFFTLSVFLLVVLAFSFLVFLFYHNNSFKLNGSVFHHRYLFKA